MREDPKLYGGNSLRKMAATLANSADLSDQTIQRLGDWVKPSTLRFYINIDLDTRLEAQARIHSKAKSFLPKAPHHLSNSIPGDLDAASHR